MDKNNGLKKYSCRGRKERNEINMQEKSINKYRHKTNGMQK